MKSILLVGVALVFASCGSDPKVYPLTGTYVAQGGCPSGNPTSVVIKDSTVDLVYTGSEAGCNRTDTFSYTTSEIRVGQLELQTDHSACTTTCNITCSTLNNTLFNLPLLAGASKDNNATNTFGIGCTYAHQ